MRRVAVGLLGVCALLLSTGLLRFLAAPAQARTPLGVLLITLDTTRADRLSPYGFMDVEMPSLERLAREGVVFDQATSVAPLTLPAHASLFTGLLPPAHGVRDNADSPLAESHTTLAEILRERGFLTGASVGSVVLDHDRGLGQGFDDYGGVDPNSPASGARLQRRGDAVVDDALAWLEQVGESSFLLWAHLYDPHAPYDAPAPFRQAHPDPYVAEILFADAQIGRLLAALDRMNLTNRTIVVIAGDHGEGLGEHGEPTHGLFVYESVLRVPLIVRGPSLAPHRVASIARLVDVMPTILELLDVSAPPTDGTSLVGAMRGIAQPDLEAYAESLYPLRFGIEPFAALRDGRYKFIDGPRPALYDLERDPFETRSIYEERRRVADAMRARLVEIAGPTREPTAGVSDLPQELRDRLAALGYVGHQARPSGTR